jgi:hypothetical protein
MEFHLVFQKFFLYFGTKQQNEKKSENKQK